MSRPWHIWILFVVCLGVAMAAMGWISVTALRLDHAEADARRQAALEENVRLALWRMDSALAPLIAQENARPYFVYSSFYPAERPYTNMFAELKKGDVLIPSPLLIKVSPYILLHFQLGPDGELTSPQVPTDNMLDLAEAGYATHENVLEARQHLEELKDIIGAGKKVIALLARDRQGSAISPHPEPVEGQARQAAQPAQVAVAKQVERRGSTSSPCPEPARPERNRRDEGQGKQSAQQMELSEREWGARQQVLSNVAPQQQQTAQKPQQPASGPLARRSPGEGGAGVSEGALQPMWAGNALLLVRLISVGKQSYVQGCRLDWPLVRKWLIEEVKGLLPGADLVPVTGEERDGQGRMLAALPLRMVPGAVSVVEEVRASPVRLALLIAWCCVLIAAAAVGVLLRGAVSLSERRGAFVSAVTHEMRTPLTTFQMYTEMLAEGMVPEEKRPGYLETLRTEAGRLGHLVENVLAYARLERGRAKGRIETVTAGELIGRMESRLAQRAEQAKMKLAIDMRTDTDKHGQGEYGRSEYGQGEYGEPAACVRVCPCGKRSEDAEAPPPATAAAVECGDELLVRTDPSAVEQILFNLVDNACKYAAQAADRRIHIVVDGVPGFVRLCVRDHGSGISKGEQGRLFRPFSKSACDAANSAPGVGLGLALSRRLARSLHGDLVFDHNIKDGACFLLTLPRA